MSICVRAGDLQVDRPVLIDLISRNLPRHTDGATFDWLYLESPHGKAHVWLAVEQEAGKVIAAAAAFPRQVYMGDSEIAAWVLGDFCLDPQYRSLGPAMELQRACLGVMESNGGKFCYDFPSAGMVAVYKRLGFAVKEKMLRLAKLLRVDRKVREIVNIPTAQRAVSAVGNSLLKLSPKKFVSDYSVEFAVHPGPCDEEFSILTSKQRGSLGICSQRSAEYLNWRYLKNPLKSHEIMTARRDGALIGYVVWAQTGEDAVVVDLFGEDDTMMVKGLLAAVTVCLTNRGVMTLSVWLNETHPWFRWYSEMGFRVRDSAPVVCISAPSITRTDDPRSGQWFLMQGDRDS
jgi:hypothetical protein